MLGKHIRNFLYKFGFDIVRYSHISHPIARRMKLLSHYGIDLIFDIGANTGQYAQEIRKRGYKGKIISFEPVSSAYRELCKRAQQDPLWETANLALGDYDGSAEIHISRQTHSSSILTILPSSLSLSPDVAVVGTEEVTVRKIDSIMTNYWHPSQRLYVKIDTQGYEKQVILGAEQTLNDVIGLEMELSLVPIYAGEALFAEMLNLITGKGFSMMAINPGLSDYSTGRLLQVDCIFFRLNF
jgi:FkbM family methyltransferase